MAYYTELENLKAEADSLEDDLELFVNIYEEGRLDPSGGVDWLNDVIDQYNNLAEEISEIVGNNSAPRMVNYPQTYNEGALLSIVTNVKQGCNHAKRVLSGYEKDLEEEKTGKPLEINQRGHDEWKKLRIAYRRAANEKGEEIVMDSVLKRIIHVSKKSQIFHSITHNLVSNRREYAKNPGFQFSILEASALQSAYSIREGIFNLVNQVWNLQIETGPENKNWRSDVAKSDTTNDVEDALSSLLSKSSPFGEFLDEYRHPDVHDETLSRVTKEDLAKAIVGESRPHIETFITDSEEVSSYLKEKEKIIISECQSKYREQIMELKE